MKKALMLTAIFLAVTMSILLPGPARTQTEEQQLKKDQTEFYDVVIFGLDRRPNEKKGHSDVIMILHCEPGRLTLFSIPRDTYAQVGSKMDKINHAYFIGGAKYAKFNLERFLRFKIDNYVTVDFETFITTIEVVKKLTDDGRLIGAENFLISGENLLKWLRYRHFRQGDRRRCQRHQLFMQRVLEYAQKLYNEHPTVFSQVVKAGLKIVDTDLTYEHTEQLFETYKDFDVEKNLERFVLPGYGKMATKINEETGEEEPDTSYYYPKYRWSLAKYLAWFRKNGVQMNYVEEDTLRK